MNCCICTEYNNKDVTKFADEKVFSIDPEEIIRRRSVAEKYFKEVGDSKNDWIETYHNSYLGWSASTASQTNEKSSFENDHGIDATFTHQNMDMHSPKNLKDSVTMYETLLSEINSDLKKTDDITSEEFIRRRNVLISLYNSLPDVKKYKVNPETSRSKDTFDNMYPPAEKLTKEKGVSSKEVTDQMLQESFITDNNNNDENLDLLKNDCEQITNSHTFETVSVSSMMESKSHALSKSNKLRNIPINLETSANNIVDSVFKIKARGICAATSTHKDRDDFLNSNTVRNNMFKDNKSDPNIQHSSTIKNDVLEINEFKNISVNSDKIIEIMIKNAKFPSKKYFIDGETLTRTEYYKLQEYLAQLSFLHENKDNVYSVSRLKMINSIGKITSLQDELNQEKLEHLCKFSIIDNDIVNVPLNNDESIKKSTTDFEKRVGYRIGRKEKASLEKIKNPFSSDTTNSKKFKIASNNLENIDTNDLDSEILRRRKSVSSFIATLNKNKKNWIETYHLNSLKIKSEKDPFLSVSNNSKESKINYNLQETAEQDEKFSKVYSQERLYIIRWINKLQNKLTNSHSDHHSLSILVSADLHNILRKFSQNFDIVTFDELINIMISNATFHNNYENTWQFDFNSVFNNIFFLLNTKFIYILIALLFSFIFLHSMHSKRWLKWKLSFSFIILSSIIWHANKMYQKKVAEKHTVMSRVVPSYCQNILVQESGILAHFKELFRSWWHDEDCKEYYEAVMVDPSAEITLLSISSDLLSDAISQMLQPFAQNMNSFFKILLYDLSFFHQILIIIITLFILIALFYFILHFSLSFFAFRRNYKINFPFNMGSTEPTEFSLGSRVEEISEIENSSLTDSSVIYNTSLVGYNKTKKMNNIENIILEKRFLKIKSKNSELEPSKHYVSKTPGILIRRNSI